MKKVIFSLILAVSTSNVIAQIDSVVSVHQMRIDELERVAKNLTLSDAQIRKSEASLVLRIDEVEKQVSNLQTATEKNAGEIASASELLEGSIRDVSERAKGDAEQVSKKVLISIVVGAVLALLLLVLSLLLYCILRKEHISAYDKIKESQKALQEEGVKLDEKLVELLDKQLAVQNATPKNSEPDHSLALKVADEIVRIETNLSRMDSSVKGYKQLSASVRRIKDNFLANGYEMVDMLGKPYSEGMKVIANFVPDESLKEGEQIITGIIKPQINYNGVMIQAAQITVSQN